MQEQPETNTPPTVGIVLVDHGSKKEASNQLLEEVAALFQKKTHHRIVEPAHMELATPDLKTAFMRCVQQGATFVVVHPYFLGPGRHVSQDIPRLAADAAAQQEVDFVVTEPLGLHDDIMNVISDRIESALKA